MDYFLYKQPDGSFAMEKPGAKKATHNKLQKDVAMSRARDLIERSGEGGRIVVIGENNHVIKDEVVPKKD